MAITKVTTDGIDMKDNTGALTWVKGTTAQQPSGALGELRVDTDTKRAVVYTDQTGTAEWRNLKESSPSFTLSYLIVAGGGGSAGVTTGTGNNFSRGAGGAGGLRSSYGSDSSGGGNSTESTLSINIGQAYDVEVGPGGASGVNGTNSRGQGH